MQIKRFRDTDSTWLIRPEFEAHFINLYHGLEHQNKSLQSSTRKSGSLNWLTRKQNTNTKTKQSESENSQTKTSPGQI